MHDIRVPLVGEPLALDLVNTLASGSDGAEIDLLDGDDTFRAWLAAQQGRLAVTDGRIDRDAIRRLRDHVARAVERARHGQRPSARDLAELTSAQRAAPSHRRLRWDGDGVISVVDRPGDPTERLVAELAEAAADLLTDPSVRLVRRCEGPGCRLLFLPVHPRRRWCSPSTCGNRVRVARYYQRHRG